MRRTTCVALALLLAACADHDRELPPPRQKTPPRKQAPPPPPPTAAEIAATAPKWQASLPHVIDTSVKPCTGEAFWIEDGKIAARHTMTEEQVIEFIDLANSGDAYWPSSHLCTCCPRLRVRIVCGARTHEVVVDWQCGWLYPNEKREDERPLSTLGRWAFKAFARELFPER